MEDLAHLLRLYEKKTETDSAAREAGAVLAGQQRRSVLFSRPCRHVGAAFRQMIYGRRSDLEADNMTILRFMTQEEAEENMVSHTEKRCCIVTSGDAYGRLMQITRSLMHRCIKSPFDHNPIISAIIM